MPEWSNGPHSKCGIRVTVSRVRIPVSPHKQAQRLGQSSLLRFFFQRTCRFPRARQPESPGPQPQASQSHPHVISTAATHTCHAIGSRKRMHRTAQERAQNHAAEGTDSHKRTRKARATRRTAQRSRRHWPTRPKTLTGLFRRDEEAAGSRRLGWRGSLPAVLPCRGMENAARCIRHRTALRFWWHSSGKQGEATWTGATRAVRCPPFCLQSIGTPYSACRNRRISAKSINFVQLWKSRQGNTMRAGQ